MHTHTLTQAHSFTEKIRLWELACVMLGRGKDPVGGIFSSDAVLAVWADLSPWTEQDGSLCCAICCLDCLQLLLPGFSWFLLCGCHLYKPCVCGMASHSGPMCFSSPVPAVIFKERGCMCLRVYFEVFGVPGLFCILSDKQCVRSAWICQALHFPEVCGLYFWSLFHVWNLKR